MSVNKQLRMDRQLRRARNKQRRQKKRRAANSAAINTPVTPLLTTRAIPAPSSNSPSPTEPSPAKPGEAGCFLCGTGDHWVRIPDAEIPRDPQYCGRMGLGFYVCPTHYAMPFAQIKNLFLARAEASAVKTRNTISTPSPLGRAEALAFPQPFRLESEVP